MARPSFITVPDKPGILDFLRRVRGQWEANSPASVREEYACVARILILHILLRVADQGRMPPMRLDTCKLFDVWKSKGGVVNSLEVRGFDDACTQLNQMLQNYRPSPSTQVASSSAK